LVSVIRLPRPIESAQYDYQGLRFIMLNGNEKYQEQAHWLEKVLSQNSNRWVVAAIHQPFYSMTKRRDNPELREHFIPLFDQYPVDLVLAGHDHSYGRTFKLRNGQMVPNNEKGTVYVVSVCGVKMYDTEPKYRELMAKIGSGEQLFQVISINKNRLKYESWTAAGDLYDRFELNK